MDAGPSNPYSVIVSFPCCPAWAMCDMGWVRLSKKGDDLLDLLQVRGSGRAHPAQQSSPQVMPYQEREREAGPLFQSCLQAHSVVMQSWAELHPLLSTAATHTLHLHSSLQVQWHSQPHMCPCAPRQSRQNYWGRVQMPHFVLHHQQCLAAQQQDQHGKSAASPTRGGYGTAYRDPTYEDEWATPAVKQ